MQLETALIHHEANREGVTHAMSHILPSSVIVAIVGDHGWRTSLVQWCITVWCRPNSVVPNEPDRSVSARPLAIARARWHMRRACGPLWKTEKPHGLSKRNDDNSAKCRPFREFSPPTSQSCRYLSPSASFSLIPSHSISSDLISSRRFSQCIFWFVQIGSTTQQASLFL